MIKYSVLPWRNALSAGHILLATAFVLIAYSIAEAIWKRHNLVMRRGTLAIIGNTVWALCLNTGVYTVAFWYWAAPLAIGVAAIFFAIIRGELKTALEEEREGAVGTFAALRQIRAEEFADLSPEEQMAYKARVKPTRFWWWLWFPAVVALPFLLILLLEACGTGDYLFRVVTLQ